MNVTDEMMHAAWDNIASWLHSDRSDAELRAAVAAALAAAPTLKMFVWCVACERVVNLNRNFTDDGHCFPEEPGFRVCSGPFGTLILAPGVTA